jgi:hypothetical protein
MNGLTDSRQRPMTGASFLMIMLRQIVGVPIPELTPRPLPD